MEKNRINVGMRVRIVKNNASPEYDFLIGTEGIVTEWETEDTVIFESDSGRTLILELDELEVIK